MTSEKILGSIGPCLKCAKEGRFGRNTIRKAFKAHRKNANISAIKEGIEDSIEEYQEEEITYPDNW